MNLLSTSTTSSTTVNASFVNFVGHSPQRQFHTDDDIFIRIFQQSAHREPPHGKSTEVGFFINTCLMELRREKFSRCNKSNLTLEEIKALKSLQTRDDIIIKPADKGGAIVVWKRELYIEEAQRQFNNDEHYLIMLLSPLISSLSSLVYAANPNPNPSPLTLTLTLTLTL